MSKRYDDCEEALPLTTNPCPSWCEDKPGHPYDELCRDPRRPGRVTHLNRMHRRTLGTVWSRCVDVTLACEVQLYQPENASPEDEIPELEEPTVAVSEEVDGFARAWGSYWMTPDQAFALAELVTIGANACREIVAGREPVLP